MLDTIVAFIVMQKFELMLDVEQFSSRLDTIDRTVSPVQNMQIRPTSGRPDKNNKRERLHVFIHRWIHKNIHTNTGTDRRDESGGLDGPKRKEKTPHGARMEVQYYLAAV